MKIAIQGHSIRGKEVIQILENLGGKNYAHLIGNSKNYYYYINDDLNGVIHCHDTNYVNKYCKKYTLEEFETQFPFKIGDKIKHITSIGIIKEYCYINNEPAYKVKSMELGIIATIPAKLLEPYKEMEIRNVTLTLDKAKEWYKKGGELKEVALQAYSEEELTKVGLPKTWEEFCRNYPLKRSEAVISAESIIMTCDCVEIRDPDCDREICPSIKSAEAHLAMIQLEQLRDCWRQGWKPTERDTGYSIIHYPKEYSIMAFSFIGFLSFPTKKMAEKFLEYFRDLIEKAGDLI